MLTIALPRHFLRVNNFQRIIKQFKEVCLKTVNMNKIEKILKADKDIERQIMTLRCEVTDVETKILDNFLIKRLQKENRELEEVIQKHRNELIQLEKANGRTQMVDLAQSLQQTFQSYSELTAKPAEVTPVVTKSNESVEESKKGKKESKKKDKEDAKKTEKTETKKPAEDSLPVDIGRLDMKVGKIIHIEKHPDADSLYVEKVDIGKPEPITVVSGLVKHVPIDVMQDSLLIVLCNLKPAKMRGIVSEGMVMCANSEGVVEVMRPPPTSVPGDIVTCPGYNYNPDTIMNPKKKIFETVAPDLKTDDEFIATYKGARWTVGDKGFIKAQTLKGANIK